MNGELQDISRMFSRAARGYECNSSVQRKLAQQLVSLLPPLTSGCGPMLELGAGTGHLTAQLSQTWPEGVLLASDVSRKMMVCGEVVRQGNFGGFVQCDMAKLPFKGSFSLVVSNAALHWASLLEEVFSEIAQVLTPRGCLVASVMIRGTCSELHSVRSEIAPQKTPQRLLFTEAECLDRCVNAGFALEYCDVVSLQEWYPSAQVAVRSLHDAGLTAGRISRGAEPLTRGELSALYRRYDERFAQQVGVPVSFRAMLIRACKMM